MQVDLEMFQQVLQKFGTLQALLRSQQQTLFSRSLCSVAARSYVTKKQGCCVKDIPETTGSSSLSSVSSLGKSVMKKGEHNSILKSKEGDGILQTSVTAPLNNLVFVRTNIRWMYRPSAIKRMRKHGLEKRISCRSQREILFRRIISGKGVLTTFDRFMNEIPEGRRKKTKRVDLFDPKRGYKSVVKKKEKFIFKEI